MAQAGYTPISLYYSTTAAAVPLAANLAQGELAINIADGKLYFENSSGVVTLLASSTTVTNSFSAGTTGFTPSTATTGAVTLGGTLITSNGGTGLASYTAGDLSYYASGTALTKLAIGTAGQFLTSTGTAPQWSTLSGVAVTTFSAGTTGFTPNTATSGAITLAGTLATTNGGTNLTSFTSGGVVYASSSSALATGSALTYDGSNFRVNSGTSWATSTGGVQLSMDGAGADAYLTTYYDTHTLTLGAGVSLKNLIKISGSGASNNINFRVNNSDAMVLTSTGLGIGTSSPAAKLGVFDAGGGVKLFNFGTSSSGTGSQYGTWTNTGAYTLWGIESSTAGGTFAGSLAYSSVWGTNNATAMHFSPNNVVAMTLVNGGNVGIGTSSIDSRLEINSSASNTARIRIKLNDTPFCYFGGYSGIVGSGNADDLALFAWTGKQLMFGTNATEKMRLDTAGNLGLGVTPSAGWNSSNRAIQLLGGYGSISANNSQGTCDVAYNCYNSTTQAVLGWKYTNSSAAATLYQQLNGIHAWHIAPSGTADAAISFTQAMTLDSSGNLGIGLSNPLYKLDVSAGSGTGIRLKSTGAYGNFIADNTGTTGGGSYAAYQNGAQITIFGVEGAILGNTSTNTAIFNDVVGGGIKLYTNASATPKATLDSAGNLGLGVTPSAWDTTVFRTLQVGSGAGSASLIGRTDGVQNAALGSNFYYGSGSFRYIADGTANYYNQQSGVHAWFSAGSGTAGNAITFTQAMTLTSGGRLLVGTTTATFPINFRLPSDSGDWFSRFSNTTASSPFGSVFEYTASAPNGLSNEFIYCNDTGGQRMSVRSNGGIANYQANDANLSDRREKTNFAPAGSYLDKICAIPVQTFNYIDQNLETDDGLTLGVVAQDVQAVAPELVSEANWGSKDKPKMRLSIYQTDLQYALMKCIQEQQAIIESLKARLDAANL